MLQYMEISMFYCFAPTLIIAVFFSGGKPSGWDAARALALRSGWEHLGGMRLQGMSMDEWDELNYDYFHRLDGNQIASSLLLQGPCYPVLSFTRSIFHTCDFTPLEVRSQKKCAPPN